MAGALRARLRRTGREAGIDKDRRELDLLQSRYAESRRAAWENAKDFGYAYRRLLAAIMGVLPSSLGNASTKAPTRERSLADVEIARKVRRDAWTNAKDFGYAYRRLLASIYGTSPGTLGKVSTVAPDEAKSRDDAEYARRVHSRSLLAERIIAGDSLEVAVATVVQKAIAAKDHLSARSLSQSLLQERNTVRAGHLGSALVAAHMNLPELAWASFGQLPRDLCLRTAPVEFFRTAFTVDRDAAVAECWQLVEDDGVELQPDTWLELTGMALGADRPDLARGLLDRCEKASSEDPQGWRSFDEELSWLRGWVAKASAIVRGASAEPQRPGMPAAPIAFAVLDYKQPDLAKTSSNIGDYIQTLAALGHLTRYRQLTFTGDRSLASLAYEMQARTLPSRQLGSVGAEIQLLPVNRDASSFERLPEPTWLIAFGWYAHTIFGLRFDFPFHENVRPIFISFHCNRPSLLSAEAIAYLRKYGPIGCRDWTTVHLLLGAGVPAFFSGCITTTIDTVLPIRHDSADTGRPVAYVDTSAPSGAPTVRHIDLGIKTSDLTENIRRAFSLLEDYQREYSRVVTSRLHCYLPVRSIGIPAEFAPGNPVDIRFNGLAPAGETELEAMRTGILAKLEPVLTAILSGESTDSVYSLWRDICAPDVAKARAVHHRVPPVPRPSFDLKQAVYQVRAKEVVIDRSIPVIGDEVHVAVALDGNLKNQLLVVVEAMSGRSSRPLHLWVLSRDHGPADHVRLATLFPRVTFTWLPCDDIDYGHVLGMLRHITVATMDRLLLPDLLPELDLLVYHDMDALTLGDISDLYDWNLDGNPIGARSAVAAHVRSGFANIYRSAQRLKHSPAKAYELLQRMHARHEFDFVSFNAGVLVLDLRRMREESFCEQFIPYVELYGMNDQEILNCYAGPRRAVLPASWNSLPTQEVVKDPEIIHWAGPLKPWKSEYVLFAEVWREYEAKVQQRCRSLGIRGPETPS